MLDPDAELSLIDEQGRDANGKVILTLISVVSPAEIEYLAFLLPQQRIKFYLLLVSSKLTAPVSI